MNGEQFDTTYFNDKRVKFIAKSDPHERLAQLFGGKYIAYRKKWVETAEGKDVLDYPLHLDIALNDTCNIRCHFCAFALPPGERGYKTLGAEKIPLPLFERIVSEGAQKGLCAVSFGNICEPLLVPDLEEYIKIAKRAGILDLILYTNAMLLTAERAASLIQAGLTWINISISAASAKTYEQMRDYANFNQVISNSLGFIEAKKALKSELPLVRVSFVNTKQNCHELDAFVAFWQEKADVVSIQNLVNWHKGTIREKQFQEHFYLERTKAAEGSGVCTQPFQRLLIRNNGDITPCCAFIGLNLVFGNVYKQSVFEVYNSPEMKAFKATLNTPMRGNVCQQCREAYRCE